MLQFHTTNPHHESGTARVMRDADLVERVVAAIQDNPFMASTPQLINISTGQYAEPKGIDNLDL